MRSLAACLLVVTLGGCVLPLNSTTARHEYSLAADQDNPALALLEYRIELEYLRNGDARMLCAAQGRGRDARPLSAEDQQRLMMRFPALAPLERCELRGGDYVDGLNGGPAALIELFDFACSSDVQCSGAAGFRYGNAVAGYTDYDLHYDGYWQVRQQPNNIVLTGDEA